MKIWLVVALLAVATSVAVAAVVAKADLTNTTTKGIEAETDSPLPSTEVAEDDEGSETTEPSNQSTVVEEEGETKKGKQEKEKQEKEKKEKHEPKEGEQVEGENEEEEGENEEEENEESEEGDSDEDSEEEEFEGKKKKEAKVESEEEGDNKEEAIKGPTSQPSDELPTRTTAIASPVVAETYKPSYVSQPDTRKTQPKWLFDTPVPKSPDVFAEVESPKFDFTKISTSAAVQVSSSSRPVAKSIAVEPRPTEHRAHHSTEVSSSDTRKPHHPKWFFNTAKENTSHRSTKIESPKPTAIFESPTRKAAAIQIPTWPSITTVKPAASVTSNKPVDFSHSDKRKSHSQWFFTTASKSSSDGFAKKESNAKPAIIEIPTKIVTENSNNRPAAYQTNPSWTQSSRPVASVEIKVPHYKPVEVSSPPRKTYPRWFFNIRD